MYKVISEMKTKDARGFTLIELLIVIAIIGILTAIAVPAFLGQREKAKVRSVQSGAKGAVSDLQAYLDAYVAGDPFIVLDSGGNQTCTQSTTAGNTGKTCASIYPNTNASTPATYTPYPGGMAEIITAFLLHHQNKGDKSPYSGNSLFTTTADVGVVVVAANGSNAATLTAYGSDSTAAIFSQLVSTR